MLALVRGMCISIHQGLLTVQTILPPLDLSALSRSAAPTMYIQVKKEGDHDKNAIWSMGKVTPKDLHVLFILKQPHNPVSHLYAVPSISTSHTNISPSIAQTLISLPTFSFIDADN
jgi:hypothetical protein